MKIKQKFYPHPVMYKESDDFVDCNFEVKINPLISEDKYTFSLEFETNSQDIEQLIENQDASYAIHLECSNTRFRKLQKSFDNKLVLELPASYLDGRVEICTFILAAKDIPNYKVSNFHQDFGEMSFDIVKGDVLAIGSEMVFSADKEIDPLIKIPSIFTVSRNDKDNAPPIRIDTSLDRINILLEKGNFEKYSILRNMQKEYNHLGDLISSLIIIPALVMLLEMIRGNIEGYDDNIEDYIEASEESNRWFRVLKSKLFDIGIDIRQSDAFSETDAVAVAYKLLGDPLPSAFKFFDEINASEEE